MSDKKNDNKSKIQSVNLSKINKNNKAVANNKMNSNSKERTSLNFETDLQMGSIKPTRPTPKEDN